MIDIMDRHTIITLMNKGNSLRAVSRITGASRKTVTRYWRDYQRQTSLIGEGDGLREIQERVTSGPSYDTSSRRPLKYTPEIDAAIDKILAGEAEKDSALGGRHKQRLTCRQIHALLAKDGFDIGLTTTTAHVGEKRKRAKEAFIRQAYDYGERLEYDFGEVRLNIGGTAGTYHLAVFASPASAFRWGYLYASQKKEAFLDSHARFFEMVGGVWREVVYDNMRNVVSRFIGRNEKELNGDLVKMSMYYGFSVNVTNCFRGNEKGYVESSVKWMRGQAFATRYAFDTIDDARAHLEERLIELNAGSRIDAERPCLIASKPPLELARISEPVVDKYSFVCVDGGFYSVPDHLVGHTLTAKAYHEEIVVYSGFSEVCRHARLGAGEKYRVDIMHYLDTLARKPGALKNSVALRSKHCLKKVFDERYADRPKDFIALLERFKDLPIDAIAERLSAPDAAKLGPGCAAGAPAAKIEQSTRAQLAAYSRAFLKAGDKVAC